ncbi:MAG: hypothetical protein LBQ71_03040 [Hungatella sp.]|nr:hypothetical protein [Hungatella sp.]
MSFQSGTLNINTNEPSTVTIDDRPIFDIIAYGGLYSDQSQTFAFTTSGETAQIMLPNQMPSFDVGYGLNTIQIFRPGDYEINFMIRIFPNSGNYFISGGVRINSSTFIPSTFQTDWETIANTGIIQGSVIATLNGGDTLDLALQATDDVPMTIVLAQNTNATLTVKRLSPFP